jgi:hypothetical protein
MASDLRAGTIDHRLVDARPRNARLKIVADRVPHGGAEISEGSKVRRDSIRQALREGRFCRLGDVNTVYAAPGWLAMAQPSIERMLWRDGTRATNLDALQTLGA